MSKNNIVALIHALAGASSLVVSFFSRGQIRVPVEPIKSIGYALFGLGALLFAYSVFYLRAAFQGNIEPTTNELITSGPYKFIRHPLYLAMLILCIGLAIGLRSLWGIALTILVFFPMCIYRAKLEEAALRVKFGQQWEEYTNQTAFLFPYIY